MASCHETCTTGWSLATGHETPGPSGVRQVAPSTAHHHGRPGRHREIARSLPGRKAAKTKDQPHRSASVS